MKLAFYFVAAAMIAVALGLLLLPIIRSGRRLGRRPRGVFAIALAIAVVLPLATAGIYLLVGTPAALDGIARQPTTIDEALDQLRAHLAQQPNDLQGWLLLAQTYAQMQRASEAHDAYERVLKLDPRNADAMIGWAETAAMLSADHRLDGRARELLQQAIQIDPQSQRGLWLLGISDFQAGQYAEAAALWRKLQPMLQPGSKIAEAIAAQISLADSRTSGTPAATASAAGAASAQPGNATAQNSPALQVQVTLAPALQAKLGADDTLFVYARAESGPPMPLAVARLQANALPAAVTLTDAMAMAPQFKLSSTPRVFVGARISKNGQAIAQAGDLEGDAGIVATDTRSPIKILIDKVHP